MSTRTPDMDDNHTIADMSGVRRGLRDGLLPQPETHGDINEELQDAEERLMVLLGTLRAALSIGAVYVVGFGIAIAIMLWLWT